MWFICYHFLYESQALFGERDFRLTGVLFTSCDILYKLLQVF